MTWSTSIHDRELIVTGGPVRVARLEQEWYEDVSDPAQVVAALKEKRSAVDVFTFWQRLPDVAPSYQYHMEWDDIAALPVSSYDHWWSAQIKSRTRGVIRKSSKEGLVVKEVEYTDEFVRGMTAIFNEAPMRQGRPFWHYGKTFETVKREFSRYLFRERLIGAYHQDELIGFMMLGLAGRYAVTGQIISKIGHRDKGTNNSMMAKAVELCANAKIPYLVYLRWGTGSLAEFKRRNGFERISLPRYYVPVTVKGSIAIRMGLHKGLTGMIPDRTLARLKRLRTRWYESLYSVKHSKVLATDGDA
jgi:hypothetical protein